MCLKESSLALGQAPNLPQLAAHDLSRSLLCRLFAGTLPDPHHRRSFRFHEPLDGLDEIVLESGAAKLSVREDLHSSSLLLLEGVEDGPVFNGTEFFWAKRALEESSLALFHFGGT